MTQHKIRLTPELHEQLLAAANGKPLSGEIVRRLEQSFRDDAVLERLERIEAFLVI